MNGSERSTSTARGSGILSAGCALTAKGGEGGEVRRTTSISGVGLSTSHPLVDPALYAAKFGEQIFMPPSN
jgi:hypothetical protein